MPGLYIHIPFCKQACHYCDFHFSTSMRTKDDLIQALIQEIDLQKNYLEGQPLSSIYFGGGTPSLLERTELELIFNQIYKTHQVETNAEITLEANPDDLTPEKVKSLAGTSINRLSIGIQSFSDKDLQFMNRAHNATEASYCIELAKSEGFDDLTIDLIYGTPTMNDEQWADNINKVLQFDIPHISCYGLTVEEKTALAHFVASGKVPPVNDEQSSRQFDYLIHQLTEAGYEHYEISNFAKPGRHAKHNSSYWSGASYLGIGPSAHSFNGHSRQWNIAHNVKYIKAINENKLPFEMEKLSAEQQFNEYILTGLRTKWGVNLDKISSAFSTHFLEQVQTYLDQNLMYEKNGTYVLTQTGKHIADRIAMELFVEI